MESLATFAAYFEADTTALDKGMDDAVRRAQRGGERVGSAFGLGFKNPALNAISGVHDLLSSVQDSARIAANVSGVSIAATYQKLRVGFEGITGSADDARRIMDDLAKQGAETPFRTEELTGYAQQLLSLGVNVRRVTSDLGAMEDAIATRGGSTSDIGQLSSILSGFRIRPKLDIREVGELGRYMDLGKVVGAATGKEGLSQLQAARRLQGMTGEKAYDTIIDGLQKTYGGNAKKMADSTVLGLTQNVQESAGLAMKSTGDLLLKPIAAIEKGIIGLLTPFERLNEATGGGAGLAFVLLLGYRAVTTFGGGARQAWSITQGLTGALRDLANAEENATIATRAAATAARSKAGAEETEALATSAASSTGRFGGIRAGLKGGIARYGPTAIGGAAAVVGGIVAQKHEGWGNLISGAGTGAMLGAEIGSVIPGVGTAIGAAVGAVIGAAPALAKKADDTFGEGTSARVGNYALQGIAGVWSLIPGVRKAIDNFTGVHADGTKVKDSAAERTAKATEKSAQSLEQMNAKFLGGGQRMRSTGSLLEGEYALAKLTGK